MKYRAILRTKEEIERPVQTLHPTIESAREWAGKVVRFAESYVDIFELSERLVESVYQTVTLGPPVPPKGSAEG